MLKRLCSMVLAIGLAISCFPITAMAMEGEWEYLAPMPTARANAAVGYYDGKIYVAGGSNASGELVTTIDIYNIQNDTWSTSLSPVPLKGYAYTTLVKDNKMYFIGGLKKTTVNLTTKITTEKGTVIYDIETDSWSSGGNMAYEKSAFSATSSEDKIYVMGGYANGTTAGTYKNTKTVEIYDIQSKTWTTGTPLPISIQSMSSQYYDNNIYVIGGMQTPDIGRSLYENLYILNTNTGQWATGTNLPEAKAVTSSQIHNEKIYIIGGRTNLNIAITDVDIYNIENDTWSNGKPMNTARNNVSSIIVNDILYVFGGLTPNDTYLNTVEAIRLSSPSTPGPEPSSKELAILLYEGEELKLLSPEDLANTANITWTSSDNSVCTVNGNGRVTAIGTGTAYIYAEDSALDYYAAIPIVVEAEGSNEESYRMALQLETGRTQKLRLRGAEEEPVTWTSFDTSIATVSQEGKVTPIGAGLVIIQAECGGETYHMYIKI